MANLSLFSGQLRVHSVKCGDFSTTNCNLIFEVKCEKFTLPMYVSFSFDSFDMMIIHLKNLARTYSVCSIDQLFTSYLPATLTLEERFNAPSIFNKLTFKNNLIWPTQNSYGTILLD